MSLPTGTVTFLFTDIEGSTILVQQLGDAYPPLLEAHHEILGSAIAGRGGVIVKTGGDSIFAVFIDAVDAVEAGLAAQSRLSGYPWPEGAVVKVRMGLHTGAGTLGGDDYVGLDVHRAARIADCAHGGQIVLSEATAILAERGLSDGVELRDLGKHRLKDLSEPESIHQVLAPGLPSDFPPLRTLDAVPNNLPLQVTSFIGRDGLLRQALQLLDGTRLLTLTGPGGTGKTRLSLQIAAEASERFPDGVFFVGLSPVTDPDILPSTILSTLGEQASARDRTPNEKLLEYLGGRSQLIVLDNFEQLLPAAPRVAEMMRASPDSKFVVTSRAPLHISGEQEMPVPPLGIPDGSDPAAAIGSEAVALFTERAMAVRPDFLVDEANLHHVVDLVRRLDGLPLAIELVASRVRLFPVGEILSRLDSRMLASGAVDLPERQRTIDGAISWSHDLLDPSLRRLFGRLSVFAGGARYDEIERVSGDLAELGITLVDGLEGLVDQSLIRSVEGVAGPRFRMLHVIREFAGARLEESGEVDLIRRRHLEAYAEMVETLAPRFLGKDRRMWFDSIEADHDNIRAALDWGMGREVDLTLRLAAACWRFWQARGHFHEADRRLRLVLAQKGGDRHLVAGAMEALGGILWWRGELVECMEVYAETLKVQKEIGDDAAVANAAYNLALSIGFGIPDYEEANRLLDEAELLYQGLGDVGGLGNIEWGRGNVALARGEYDVVLIHMKESAQLYEQVGNEFGRGWALFEISHCLWRKGEAAEAWPYVRDGLNLFAGHEDVSGVALVLTIAGGVAKDLGDLDRAVRLGGAFHGLRLKTGANIAINQFNTIEGLDYETLEALDGDLGSAYAEGKAMTFHQAVEYALAGPGGD